MKVRSSSWEIAADLEAAAKAVREVELAICNCHESAWSEINKIIGIEFVGTTTANALQALSDKYQAIADAELEI